MFAQFPVINMWTGIIQLSKCINYRNVSAFNSNSQHLLNKHWRSENTKSVANNFVFIIFKLITFMLFSLCTSCLRNYLIHTFHFCSHIRLTGIKMFKDDNNYYTKMLLTITHTQDDLLISKLQNVFTLTFMFGWKPFLIFQQFGVIFSKYCSSSLYCLTTIFNQLLSILD